MRFSFRTFLSFSVLFSYMFVSDKKTYQNRVHLSVLARFLKGGGEGNAGVDCLVQIFKFFENFFKNEKNNYDQIYLCIVIKCRIPLKLGSKLACIA